MLSRFISFLLVLSFFCASPLLAQIRMWEWSKQVSVSMKTDWDASHVDDQGNFYFVGTSEKFVGNEPPRSIVISKWSSDTTALWQTRYAGGSTITKSDITTDAAGNVTAIVYFSGKLTRPDGTEMSHFLDAFAIIKLDKDGQELWSKRLTVGEYNNFTVRADGSIGMRVSTGINFEFGDSTVTSPNGADQFLLISPDGGLRAMINPALVLSQPFKLLHTDWSHEGKVDVWTQVGNFAPVFVIRGEIDLATGVYTPQDSLEVNIGAAYDFDMKQIETDPATGHSFALIKVGRETTLEGGAVLQRGVVNDEGYVVEFDADLTAINKIAVSNPLYITVRDTQVVVTAKHPLGVGFVSDETTIPALGIADGHIVYVMDRNLKYRRHAVAYPRTASSFPENTMIDSKGGVYLHMESNYDLFFDQRVFVAPLSSDASIIVLAKVGGAPASGVGELERVAFGAAYPNPAERSVTVDLGSGSTYMLSDAMGRIILAGSGFEKQAIDISAMPVGGYVLSVTQNGVTSSQKISIVR